MSLVFTDPNVALIGVSCIAFFIGAVFCFLRSKNLGKVKCMWFPLSFSLLLFFVYSFANFLINFFGHSFLEIVGGISSVFGAIFLLFSVYEYGGARK